MALDRPHDRRHFIAGGAITAAALAGVDVAQADPGSPVFGGVVEQVLSPTTLAVTVPDLDGASRTLVLGAGVAALHGFAGVVTTVEAFRPGERVVFMPADGAADGDEITVAELSSLVASQTIDVTSGGPTIRSSQGAFYRSANLRGIVPQGRVEATYWVDPSSGDRYLCDARGA